MKPVDFRHSAAVRVAALFVGLFTATTILVFAGLYVKTRVDLDEHQRDYIIEVQEALLADAGNGGMAALAMAVTKKATGADDDDTVFLLTTGTGEFVAGNIQSAPQFSGWKSIPWESLKFIGHRKIAEQDNEVVAIWTNVPGGKLLVGNSDSDVEEAGDVMLEGLGFALLGACAAALAGGTFLGMRARKRIQVFSEALDAISDGDLTVRIPHVPVGDELNHVAGRINSALDRLQSSVESIRQVTTDIAHDLKAPIGRVRQRLKKASEEAGSASEYQSIVSSTVGEIDRIVDTFNSLLNIAQIEAGLKKQRFSDQLLQPILATVVDAYGAVAEDSGHQLTSDLSGLGSIEVLGDKELLCQMFANLVENTIRHCPPGTHISIAGYSDQSRAVVRIADNGEGIPAEERKKVFRRLYRLEKSRTTPGSGLGLSLVAAIVDLHDGKIELKDNCPGLLAEIYFPPVSDLRSRAAE